MKKILIVISTHGHEKIGFEVMKKILGLEIIEDSIKFEIGNPRATELKARYIDADLNRVFPGRENGNYEERRAFELSKKICDADIVIDIHSTNTTDLGVDSMLIVTKFDKLTKEFVDVMRPPKTLVMSCTKDNALISQARVGIAFEYGRDDSQAVIDAITFDIALLCVETGNIRQNPLNNPRIDFANEVYDVYEKYDKDFDGTLLFDSRIRNFEHVEEGQLLGRTDTGREIHASDAFHPVLFGEKSYTDILGFKAKKIV